MIVRYAIFDIETRIDKRLLNETLYRDQGLDEEEAFRRHRDELREHQRGSDFFPVSFHVPISIAIGSVAPDFSLERIEILAEDDYSEERLVREFWERVEKFPGCLVSFNGRNFDLPVLELQALRWGCVAPKYFGGGVHRHRYRQERHYDLYDFLTNFGMYRVRGGFDLVQRLIGLDGKGAIDGSKVQELWEAGRLPEIHRYCADDVRQTYLLFLRIERMRGRLDPGRCEELTALARRPA